MARVELNVKAPDFIPPQSVSYSAIKNAVCKPHVVSRIYFILAERSTLNDFNGRSVTLSK